MHTEQMLNAPLLMSTWREDSERSMDDEWMDMRVLQSAVCLTVPTSRQLSIAKWFVTVRGIDDALASC